MIKAVLFDFDGTLADSSEGIFSTARKVMHDMGYSDEWSDREMRKFIGPPLRECFKVAFSLPDSMLDEAVERYRAIYKQTGYKMCSLYDGIKRLIVALRALKIKIAVATNKEQSTVEECIKALGITYLFDSIYGTDLAGKLKKADLIRLACKDFSLSPKEVLMVGDTENDRVGAKDAGVEFVGVTWGFGYSLPWTLDGVYHINKASELLDIIKKIEGDDTMIEKIETKNAPAAIGPYSQAVKSGNLLFLSGQIPVDPSTGNVVEGTTADQARQCLKNIEAVLKEAGAVMSNVVKTTVFLKDMNDFVPVNEVYKEAFSSSDILPARSAVQVAKLPKDVGVEIEVIAVL